MSSAVVERGCFIDKKTRENYIIVYAAASLKRVAANDKAQMKNIKGGDERTRSHEMTTSRWRPPRRFFHKTFINP
jgi:hypothetical protein